MDVRHRVGAAGVCVAIALGLWALAALAVTGVLLGQMEGAAW